MGTDGDDTGAEGTTLRGIDMDTVRDRTARFLHERPVQIAFLVFILSFVTRYMFIEHGLWQDEGREMMIARNLLQGDGFEYRGSPPGQHPFVFFFILAAAFLVFGATDTVGTMVVILMGALTASLAYMIGERIFNRYAGIAAGVLMATTPIHWHVSIRVITDVPVVFFTTAALYCFIRAEQEDSVRWFYATAVATGLAILTKLTALFLLPVFGLILLYNHRWDTFRMRKVWIGLGGVAAMVSTWEIFNLHVHDETKIAGLFVREFRSFFGGERGSMSGGSGTADYELAYYVTNLPDILGLPFFVLFIVGLLSIYLYREMGSMPVLIFLGVVFAAFTLKTANFPRRFLPFVPIAAVVAGYGVDRIRAGTSALGGHNLGRLVFAAALVVSTILMFNAGSANLEAATDGFTHLDEAGEWLNEHTDEDDKIIVTSINQVAWYADRENVTATYHLESPDETDAYIRENDIEYVQVDMWEQQVHSRAPYVFEHYAESPLYEPVAAFPQNTQQPRVIIYQVMDADR